MNIFVHFSNHLLMIYLIIVRFKFYIGFINNSICFSDAVYTERINGLKTNAKSVREKKTDFAFIFLFIFQSRRPNIRNKSLAIVHGTADGKTNDKKKQRYLYFEFCRRCTIQTFSHIS
jgi:hypothetical protein